MGVEMRMPGRKSGAMPTLTPDEMRRLRESMPDLITDQFETIGAAVDGCDVIVGANAHQYAAPSIAEHAGIGCVTAVSRRSRFPRQTSHCHLRRARQSTLLAPQSRSSGAIRPTRGTSARAIGSTTIAVGSAWSRSMTCSTTP
jgi:hypothetical protein